jgi:hypothetical protein
MAGQGRFLPLPFTQLASPDHLFPSIRDRSAAYGRYFALHVSRDSTAFTQI